MLPYDASFWYRHESDAERSLRTFCQMSAAVRTPEDALTEVLRLQEQGYTVQRVILQKVCSACEGAGHIGYRPKGTRKSKILKTWQLVYRECATCLGEGVTSSEKLPVTELPHERYTQCADCGYTLLHHPDEPLSKVVRCSPCGRNHT